MKAIFKLLFKLFYDFEKTYFIHSKLLQPYKKALSMLH